MKVAMPIWQGRISPVMDAARRLLIVEYDGDLEVNRIEELIAGRSTFHLAHHLKDLGLDLLICGAISHPLYSLVAAQGIKVIPWITGQTEEILKAYRSNCLESPQYIMPGCHRRGRGYRQGRRRGVGHDRQQYGRR